MPPKCHSKPQLGAGVATQDGETPTRGGPIQAWRHFIENPSATGINTGPVHSFGPRLKEQTTGGSRQYGSPTVAGENPRPDNALAEAREKGGGTRRYGLPHRSRGKPLA